MMRRAMAARRVFRRGDRTRRTRSALLLRTLPASRASYYPTYTLVAFPLPYPHVDSSEPRGCPLLGRHLVRLHVRGVVDGFRVHRRKQVERRDAPPAVTAPSTIDVTMSDRHATVSSYVPISASTSVSSVSPRGAMSRMMSSTMYDTVVKTETRLRRVEGEAEREYVSVSRLGGFKKDARRKRRRLGGERGRREGGRTLPARFPG